MPDTFVDYYLTPYDENRYCFVHSSGNPTKFIFSSRFTRSEFHSGQLKLERLNETQFLLVNDKVNILVDYKEIPLQDICGTAIREPYLYSFPHIKPNVMHIE